MLLEGVQAAAKDHGVESETILDRGAVSERILAQVKELGVDLVVLGSSGASGGGRGDIGSSVERVTMKIDIPVLVV